MYTVKRNNYHSNPKNSTIYTPQILSRYLFDKIQPHVPHGLILDIGSGMGSLSKPWKKAGYKTLGIDIDPNSTAEIKADFLKLKEWKWEKPGLILTNPPFSGNGAGKKLITEEWMDKIVELFGRNIPIVLFAPVGFRTNQKRTSKRHKKFIDGTYPEVSFFVTLPLDTFKKTLFHQEILIFNITKSLGGGAYFFSPIKYCNFCFKEIEANINGYVKNRYKLRFWTEDTNEDRLVCRLCLKKFYIQNTLINNVKKGKYGYSKRRTFKSYEKRGMFN